MLDSVLHKTFIDVNRAGTRAAAISCAVMVGCAAPGMLETREVILDRPFVFAVMSEELQIPVFAGVVNRL